MISGNCSALEGMDISTFTAHPTIQKPQLSSWVTVDTWVALVVVPEFAIHTTTNFVIGWFEAVAWTIFWVAAACDAVTNFTTVEPVVLAGAGDGWRACTGNRTRESWNL